MSLFFAALALLLILFLDATGNIDSPEEDDIDLFRRSWDPEDPGEKNGMTKRAGFRNKDVALRDCRRFLEIARKQLHN